MNHPAINSDRLWSEIMESSQFGQAAGGGITRRALTEPDVQARNWLIEKMRQAGLEVRIDDAMNVIGTLKAKSPRSKKAGAMGSHFDTVPNGGRFDGILGVLAALECARTFNEHGIDLPWDLEVISFCDEEAGYNAGTIGSRAMMGLLQDGEIYLSKGKEGPTFADNLKRLGKDPENIYRAKRDPSDLVFFLELHIEQGRVLENAEKQIGVVTAIVGIYRYVVTVRGEAAHAGTTPMHLRQDALVEAAPMFTMLPAWVVERNPDMVGTIGQVKVEPGATNVVPGECTFIVELRSQLPEDMQAVRDRLFEYCSKRSGWDVKKIYEKDSVQLSAPMIDIISAAAGEGKLNWMAMPSGAGHDAQTLAPSVPTGMIFVPCRGGISHSPREWIEPQNAADGCQVLFNTVQAIAEKKSITMW
ncbi:MAG: Zn-dependent hydrolase [Desulfofustis sp.]|jgi:hydantoinase/carbamoylase family amidase|nr:Zn-dependent hydrolase [Desulfofustis sp.]